MLDDPIAVFVGAQDAMERGDLAAFFGHLDRKDLIRLGANAVAGLLAASGAADLSRLCEEHAVPSAAIEAVRGLLRDVVASAERMRAGGGPSARAASDAHRRLVRQYEKALAGLVGGVSSLPDFVAGAAAAFRRANGGGIVSSSLFLGERLEDVAVEGDRGWATRVGETASGTRYTEDVGFLRDRSGAWRIRLFAKRPRQSGARGKGR